jgi:hypothetical protein
MHSALKFYPHQHLHLPSPLNASYSTKSLTSYLDNYMRMMFDKIAGTHKVTNSVSDTSVDSVSRSRTVVTNSVSDTSVDSVSRSRTVVTNSVSDTSVDSVSRSRTGVTNSVSDTSVESVRRPRTGVTNSVSDTNVESVRRPRTGVTNSVSDTNVESVRRPRTGVTNSVSDTNVESVRRPRTGVEVINEIRTHIQHVLVDTPATPHRRLYYSFWVEHAVQTHPELQFRPMLLHDVTMLLVLASEAQELEDQLQIRRRR